MNVNDMLMIGGMIEMQAKSYEPKTRDAIEGGYAEGILLAWIFGILGLVLTVAGIATDQEPAAVGGVVALVVAFIGPMIGRATRDRQLRALELKEQQDYEKALGYYAWLREEFKNALREVRDEDRGKVIEDWLQRNERMLTPETLAKIRKMAQGEN